jgi:hypothetical protein
LIQDGERCNTHAFISLIDENIARIGPVVKKVTDIECMDSLMDYNEDSGLLKSESIIN